MRGAGFTVHPAADGALHVQASTEQVGRTAADAGQVLVELTVGGGGLEDLYFDLTTGAAA